MKAPQKSLKEWTEQKWTTKSGKRSSDTGERYLPEAAIKALSPAEYAATTKAKREGKAKGKQFVAQPKAIAKKTAKHRWRKTNMATKKQTKKIAKVMGEFKEGSLHSGKGGKVVKSPKQAIAIALSEAKVKAKKNG